MNEPVDMSQFIAARSDQLNADDLMDNPRTIMITKVTASPDSAEQPVSIHYQGGEGRPFKPCKTMRRIMVAMWGKDASQYVGRSMTLYRDPDVQFGGMKVGGIRVSHMSHLPEKKTVALLVTRGRKAPYTVLPLANAPSSAAETADPAVKWSNGFKAKLETLTDAMAIEAFEMEKSAKLAELQGARPELYKDVMAALDARKAALTPSPVAEPAQSGFDDDDLTAEPKPEAEARQPETLLEQVDNGAAQQPGDDPAATRANAIVADIKAADAKMDIDAILIRDKDHIDAMPSDLSAYINQMADARKAEIDASRQGATA